MSKSITRNTNQCLIKIVHVLFYLPKNNFVIDCQHINSTVPVDDGVEYYEEDDWGPDVENCVHPDKVDIEVPEVVPGA